MEKNQQMLQSACQWWSGCPAAVSIRAHRHFWATNTAAITMTGWCRPLKLCSGFSFCFSRQWPRFLNCSQNCSCAFSPQTLRSSKRQQHLFWRYKSFTERVGEPLPYVEHILCPRYGEKKSEEHTKLLQDRRASIDKRSELHDRARFGLYTGEGSYQQFEEKQNSRRWRILYLNLYSHMFREN